MRKSWQISGIQATWTMTVTAEPVPEDEGLEVDRLRWPEDRLERLGSEFRDIIELTEWQLADEVASRRD